MASHNSGDPPDGLSPKALEIKKAIDDGTYKVDLDCLAERLLNDGALDDEDETEGAAEKPSPVPAPPADES